MAEALSLAAASAVEGEVPVGAVVYRGDEILGASANRRERDADPTAHAEILAMRAAGARLGHWRLVGCTLAVTLEPCPMCAGAIVNSRVDRLIYAAADPKAGAVGSLMDLCADPRLNHRPTVERADAEQAAAAAEQLRAFFRARRA